MSTNAVLVRAAQGVTFLFAAFSGFLKGIAPPEERDAAFAIGTASLISLCILLLVSNWSRKQKDNPKDRRLWFALAGALTLIALCAGLTYYYNTNRLTFRYPPDNPHGWYIAGTEYLPAAAVLAEKGISPAEVVAEFGGLPNMHLVWRTESIQRARMILMVNYLMFTVCIAGAVFSLIEIGARAPLRRS